MTKLETILKEAESLSAGERAQLLAMLIQKTANDTQTDEVAAAQRGLAAWTESTRDESWSAFYPDNLRNGRRNSKPAYKPTSSRTRTSTSRQTSAKPQTDINLS